MNKNSKKTFDEFIRRTADRADQIMGRDPINANPAAGTHKGRPSVIVKTNPARGMGMGKGRMEYRMGFKPSPFLLEAEGLISPEEWATMTPELLTQLYKERAGITLSGNPKITQNRINEMNYHPDLTPELHEVPEQPKQYNEVEERGEPGTLRSFSAHEELIKETTLDDK